MPGRRFFKNTKPRKCRPPLLLVAAISLLSRTIQRGRGPSHLSAHVKFPIQQRTKKAATQKADLQATSPRTAPRLSQG